MGFAHRNGGGNGGSGGADSCAPQELFPGLYEAAEMAGVFADSKTFADAAPRTSAAAILRDYQRQRPRSKAALRQFVAAHFTVPSPVRPPVATPDATAITEHIDGLWNTLTRAADSQQHSSLLVLPNPYVVPGGRFRELYYWDSYFTMLGLAQSGRADLLEQMVGNFAYLIDRFGHVPNGTRTYYLSRSQPPFFFEMVALLPSNRESPLVRYLPQLRREHAYWMRGSTGLAKNAAHGRVVAMPDGSILNRYWDDLDQPRDESYREDVQLSRRAHRNPHSLFRDIRAAAESGWDFSSRWFADSRNPATIDTTQIVPVDLNSLLFGLELAISAGCLQVHDEACTATFAQYAAARRAPWIITYGTKRQASTATINSRSKDRRSSSPQRLCTRCSSEPHRRLRQPLWPTAWRNTCWRRAASPPLP